MTWLNHALHPTPGSGFSSAARFTATGPAWLSLGRLGVMFARFTILALLLCGCSSLAKPNTASWPSAARDSSTLREGKFWTPTVVERARAEQLARWYATRHLELPPGTVSKMKTDCTGWHEHGLTELCVRFFDPQAFDANTDFSTILVDGGFPTYFTVTVDVGSWRVVDHYASRE